jgi:large repetitive protein
LGILDTVQNKLVDAISYEGAINGVTLGGTMYNFQEGAASTAAFADSNTVAGSLSRKPNGQDTNVNTADFQFVANTPGTAN